MAKESVSIREIKPAEYEFLAEMLRKAIFFPDPSRKDELMSQVEPVLKAYFDGFGRKGDIAFVLLTNSTLGGAVWTRLYTLENHSYGFVDEDTPELGIALKRPMRNKGYGTRLMGAMETKLIDSGFSQVSLSVDKRNPALSLYKRLGFQVHSETKNSYTMLKKLGSS